MPTPSCTFFDVGANVLAGVTRIAAGSPALDFLRALWDGELITD